MKPKGPIREHVVLCLRVILQARLHNLDDGFSEEKVIELCNAIGVIEVPETHCERVLILQRAAASILINKTDS